MNDAVATAKLGGGARESWTLLQSIAGGGDGQAPAEPVKTPASPAGASLSPGTRRPDQPPLPGEHLTPPLKVSLASAQIPDRPLPRAQ
jgi:hypothetical protein